MGFRTVKLSLLASVMAAGFALPAMAGPLTSGESVIFDDNNKGATGNFGNVTVTNISGGGVTVLVTPASCCGFVKTGAGDALLFNFSTSSITVGSLTTGFSLVGSSTGTVNSGSISKGSFGDYEYGILCSTACSKGGSAPDVNPFSFTIDSGVSGVTVADFTANAKGNIFTSDLCFDVITTTDKCAAGANTGTADAQVPGSPPPVVPEPLTLSVFGAGLAGAAALRRRKKA